MKHATIARIAGVSQPDVSNFYAERWGYLTQEKVVRIVAVIKASQTELIEWHFSVSPSLTTIEATTEYGICRLSERVRELNARYERQGDPRRIINTETQRGIGVHAVYEMREG